MDNWRGNKLLLYREVFTLYIYIAVISIIVWKKYSFCQLIVFLIFLFWLINNYKLPILKQDLGHNENF